MLDTRGPSVSAKIRETLSTNWFTHQLILLCLPIFLGRPSLFGPQGCSFVLGGYFSIAIPSEHRDPPFFTLPRNTASTRAERYTFTLFIEV